MLVLSSPSGAGKPTLSRKLLDADKNISLMSVSATTRSIRPGEIDGQDYFFVPPEEFRRRVWLKQGRFLEHATVFGNRYGTPSDLVMLALENGQDVLFDIDWQGTQQLKEKKRDDLVSIFILPPSHDELERRLRNRAQDTHEVVAGRMAKAADEISHWAEYDYIILNDDLFSGARRNSGHPSGRTTAPQPAGRHSGVCAIADPLGGFAICQRPRQRRELLDVQLFRPRGGVEARLFRSKASASGTSVFRLWRSILRRWPKAAAVTVSRSFKAQGARGSAKGSSRTIDEVTEGGGTKALRLTSN